MKQEEKTLLSKSKILAAAGEVFAQKGYDMATMQDITEKCGLSKGAIYHHFKSKEEIMLALGGYRVKPKAPYSVVAEPAGGGQARQFNKDRIREGDRGAVATY